MKVNFLNQSFVVGQKGVLLVPKKTLADLSEDKPEMATGKTIKVVGCDEYGEIKIEVEGIYRISYHKKHKGEKTPEYAFITGENFKSYVDGQKLVAINLN